MNKNKLADDIMALLKESAKESKGFQYVNPHFLSGLSNLLSEYYELEDDKVDEWITNMWSA